MARRASDLSPKKRGPDQRLPVMTRARPHPLSYALQQAAGGGSQARESPLLQAVGEGTNHNGAGNFAGWRCAVKRMPALQQLFSIKMREARQFLDEPPGVAAATRHERFSVVTR